MASTIGKVALVTGGASGIGLAIVKELLKNDIKGVAIVDISENGQNVLNDLQSNFQSEKIIFIKADVSNGTELEEAFEKTVNTFKNLDIVINNAGVYNEVTWEKTIAVDLIAVVRGTMLAMEKYLPKYKSGEEGIIVNTASIVGLSIFDSMPIYTTCKHGIVALGFSLGTENHYKKSKVKILTVCPGFVDTTMADTVAKSFANIKIEEIFPNLIVQSLEYVAKKYVNIINEGRNGSVWVIENYKPPYEVTVPDKKSRRKWITAQL